MIRRLEIVRKPFSRTRSFANIENAIAATRAGQMVIVVDDEDRENEGELTIAAEKITPEAINFMARYCVRRAATAAHSSTRLYAGSRPKAAGFCFTSTRKDEGSAWRTKFAPTGCKTRD